MAAAELGDVEILDKLIGYGCDLGQRDTKEWDTLCYCLTDESENHFSCLQRCLEEDEKVFAGSLAIILAVEKAELGVLAAREILAKSAMPDVVHHVWSKRLAQNRVVFRDWLHTFELEIQA